MSKYKRPVHDDAGRSRVMDDVKKHFNSLPDLPALESVEMKNWGTLLLLSFHLSLALLFAGACIWGYFAYLEFLPSGTVALIAAMGALCVWVVVRLLFADRYYRTSSKGLIVNSVLRRRFIQWADVSEAHASPSVLGDTYLTLSTRAGRISVPCRSDGKRFHGVELSASVWQHLRQCGKGQGLELSPEALSLWDVIPDEAPHQMEWHGGSKRPEAIAAVCCVLLYASMGCWFAVDIALDLFHVAFGGIVLMGGIVVAWLLLREARNTASRFSLSDQGFDAETLWRRVSVSWSEVTGARWERQNLALVYGRKREQVWVPLVSGDEASGKLILALIRRLRTIGSPQALAIPGQLRASAHPAPESEQQSAELRMATWETLISPIVVIIPSLMVFIPLEGKPVLQMVAGAILFGIYCLSVRAADTYAVRADDVGVTKRFLWWAKSARWEDVASVVACPRAESASIRRTLKGADGKTLIDAGAGVGSKRDKEQFITFVDAKLTEVLPDSGTNARWLARPYGSQSYSR